MKMEILPLAHEPYENLCNGGTWTLNFKDWRNERMPLAQLSTTAYFTEKANVAGANTMTANTAATVAATKSAKAKNSEAMAANILPYLQNDTTNKMKNSITKQKTKRTGDLVTANTRVSNTNSNPRIPNSTSPTTTATNNNNNLYYCDDVDAATVNELSLRLLDELRAAKSRHLTCTEVSLPCDLTERIAVEIIRVSEKEPCGIRGCTIYIEFEDEPNNSRRIASLKLDPEMVSTFEVYLTLRQDHRGWTALLPQFMKSLARTITISPEFTITKHKLYSPDRSSSYSYGIRSRSNTATSSAIATPTS